MSLTCKTRIGFAPFGKMATESYLTVKRLRSIKVAQRKTKAPTPSRTQSHSIYGPELIISKIAVSVAVMLPTAGEVPITFPRGIVAEC